jgi:hypothetical protein
MSILKRLFGGGAPGKAETSPEIYKDFRIYAEPVRASGGYRLAARIEKEVDGALRRHHLVRADTFDSEDAARDHALRKARTLIDQQGDKLLDA